MNLKGFAAATATGFSALGKLKLLVLGASSSAMHFAEVDCKTFFSQRVSAWTGANGFGMSQVPTEGESAKLGAFAETGAGASALLALVVLDSTASAAAAAVVGMGFAAFSSGACSTAFSAGRGFAGAGDGGAAVAAFLA
eukprot:CAMPEP_0194756232 /NCGR_PEP_ID=MMETSP0323_2-20130528/9966_1 /TAXON_ID=2866 ORGANISM="Crypthecodinium cohnii, Strain Seligo" /NCGR_SAMPLE_ID=MMETSP0323_2 /ASSEMBLY_ACC=CAM_ASM_000346 /LENGTH=138 /DNA_ID=CAMNT_0039675641 /DNA_START=396 /DNA_END=808 /DNA_ORIENTATION=-